MAFKTVGILNRAGVKTAITTDHPVSLIASLPLCAGLAVKAGLPLEEGYRARELYIVNRLDALRDNKAEVARRGGQGRQPRAGEGCRYCDFYGKSDGNFHEDALYYH